MRLANKFIYKSAARKIEHSARHAATEIAIAYDQDNLYVPIAVSIRRIPLIMQRSEYEHAIAELTAIKLGRIGLENLVSYDEKSSKEITVEGISTPMHPLSSKPLMVFKPNQ